MRILITSGGTKVPIDPVRDITNMSNGTFGSKIAEEALKLGHHVTFLCAERSATPFSTSFDFNKDRDWGVAIGRLSKWYNFCEESKARYVEERFKTFDDYSSKLCRLLTEVQPDAVVLSAAVSDFTTTASTKKERSGGFMSIDLRPTNKVIDYVRKWSMRPDELILVGFKLLVNSTPAELTDVAWNMLQRCNADMVVANDLSSLKAGKHEIYIVEPEETQVGNVKKVSHYTSDLALSVIQHISRAEAKQCNASCLVSQAQ